MPSSFGSGTEEAFPIVISTTVIHFRSTLLIEIINIYHQVRLNLYLFHFILFFSLSLS